ncbi:class I SAM-dependent methyltransferase [Nonomuraea sp. NPDC050310]|uniref:class I SAM-dependent methyltransferase n=1 Tax=Nonomuraea sp. NPDC050310 TaxID=3154935 RepID=UPI0033C1EAEC
MAEDVWTRGDAYERYMGRWGRLVAAEFVPWLRVPAGGRWLDAGCGTGALAATVLGVAEPAEVAGIDASVGFVAHARGQVSDPRARFEVGDAQALPYPDDRFDAAVSGLVVNFLPEPERALREFVRVVAPGGVVAAYVWDYAEGMGMIRSFWTAALALDPDRGSEAALFPLCRPGPLEELWTGAGLREVAVEAIEVATVFRDFADFWTPFLAGVGPAPAYVVSLGEEHRADLRERLRASLPVAEDGSIALKARAWAVRGLVGPEKS